MRGWRASAGFVTHPGALRRDQPGTWVTLWTGNNVPALFRFAAARPGRRKAAQFFCPSVDDAEVDVAEPKEPVAIGRLSNADGLAGERLADEYEIAAPLDLAGGTDPAHGVLGVIPRLLEALGERPRGRSIAADRGLLAERLVWPKFVEERNELIEAGLLLAGSRRASRAVCFSGVPCMRYMASVLLRRARVDPLRPMATSHHTESWLRPAGPVEAKGGPLSMRIRHGSPRSRNKRSQARRTPASVRRRCARRARLRLTASLTVKGSQRCPSRVRSHPLKSMPQIVRKPRLRG